MDKCHGHNFKHILIIITVFFIVHLSALLVPQLYQWVNTRIYNLCFQFRYFIQGAQPVSPYLLLFTLDDQFDMKYNTPGRERVKMAEALENIKATGARTILLDIIYQARDNTGLADEMLAAATRSSGNIFYPMIVSNNGNPGEALPDTLADKVLWSLQVTGPGQPHKVRQGTAPFPELIAAARSLGGITLFPESDGIIQRIPLVYSLRNQFLPSLVLAGICDYFQVDTAQVEITFGKRIVLREAVLPGGGVKDVVIPIDAKGQMLINFTGPWREAFTSFSLENVLATAKEPNKLKVVAPGIRPAVLFLIGDVTTAAKDICRGIFDANYPMVGIIHNSLNTILTEKYLYQPVAVEQVIISLLLTGCLFLIGFLRKEGVNITWLLLILIIYVIIIFGLFLVTGRLPDLFLHFSAIAIAAVLILRLELKEIKRLIMHDDVLEIPGNPSKGEAGVPDEKQQKDRQPFTAQLAKIRLSTTQREVAELLCSGLQYKEIGSRLGISTTAVGRRINRMYLRLGVNNKIEFINKIQ